MARPALEVADIFRAYGPAFREAHAGRLSLGQLKVMSAIERCRTAALGGHVARCEACAHTTIAYNSCRNRHCPKCQGAVAKQWLAERQAEMVARDKTWPAMWKKTLKELLAQNRIKWFRVPMKTNADVTSLMRAAEQKIAAAEQRRSSD